MCKTKHSLGTLNTNKLKEPNLQWMEQSEPNNALGLHFQLETKNQKDNQLGVAESMSYSQFSMSCKTHQPKKTHWNFPWQFSLNKMQKNPQKRTNFWRRKKTYEPAERRAKTKRSPSLMSSKTLQPSQVTLGFWIESDWELFWDIIMILYWRTREISLMWRIYE